jgi:hypothetical protein
MYCPNCAVSNDDAKYCRGCGANLSLVPQALTGQLPNADSSRSHKRGKHGKGPDLGDGIQKISLGVAFLLIAFILGFVGGGRGWWFWLLIPSFALLGKGVAEIVTAKLTPGAAAQAPMPPAYRPAEMPPHITGPIVPPPSVTEGTTRHLDATPDSYKR